MTRGGRDKTRDEPERRCIASGDSTATERMIRFVLAPDGALTPDLAERLPGRGAWLTADRGAVETACRKRLFSRAFKTQVTPPEDLADQLEALLARRAIESLSLARKAGQAVTGFEKVREALWRAEALLQAYDGAEDGKSKLRNASMDEDGEPLPIDETLSRSELGLAFGRDYAIHVALMKGGAAARVLRDCARLRGLRTGIRGERNGSTLDKTHAAGLRRPGQSAENTPAHAQGSTAGDASARTAKPDEPTERLVK